MKIFHDEKLKQINFLDERFYTQDNVNYYPSVTTILEVYPKGYGFTQWLKDLGMNADEVVKRAGEQGSKIHDAIFKYLSGEKLTWVDEKNEENYSIEEWKMILKFVEFWTTYKPEIVAKEISLVDKDLGFGGTIDLVFKLEDKLFLMDYKSSNAIHKSHELQLSAYATLWNKLNPKLLIDRVGVLHLKAKTRGPNGKRIQGEGWLFNEFERSYKDAFKLFKHSQEIWLEENPVWKPKNKIYPDFIELKV